MATREPSIRSNQKGESSHDVRILLLRLASCDRPFSNHFERRVVNTRSSRAVTVPDALLTLLNFNRPLNKDSDAAFLAE